VRRERITPGETTQVGRVRCTSPLRTAYDLGRQEDLVDAVVAVDRLVDRGWRIYRYTKYEVYGDPGRAVAELTRRPRPPVTAWVYAL